MTATGAGPWQHFADSYFGGTSVQRRVEADLAGFAARTAHLHHQGDAAADPLARAIVERRVLRSDFELVLAEGVEAVRDPAPELVAFFESVELPDCIDKAAVDRGSTLLRRLPPTVSLAHGAIAGFTFAAIYPNSGLALSLNEAIVESTHRRYAETAKYVADTFADGGRQRFSPSFATACRVRLVHAFVRTEIERHVEWNTGAYGTPINQFEVLVASTVTGTWMLPFAERRGYRFTDAEKHDVAMFTAYQAHVQGVPARDLVTTYEEWGEHVYGCLRSAPLPLPEDIEAIRRVLRPLTADGYPLSANARVTRMFNDFILEETRTAFGGSFCDDWDIHPVGSGATAVRLVDGTNSVLSAMRNVPGLRAIHDGLCDRYWTAVVPRMIERITGRTDVDYTETAAVAA